MWCTQHAKCHKMCKYSFWIVKLWKKSILAGQCSVCLMSFDICNITFIVHCVLWVRQIISLPTYSMVWDMYGWYGLQWCMHNFTIQKKYFQDFSNVEGIFAIFQANSHGFCRKNVVFKFLTDWSFENYQESYQKLENLWLASLYQKLYSIYLLSLQ